jgi:plastocyanin
MVIATDCKLRRGAIRLAALAATIHAAPAGTAAATNSGLRKPAVAIAILCFAYAIPLLAGAAAQPYLVTQKGQKFNPGLLSIHRGETVEIFNNDGELIHHAYVDSKVFSFDSGDQEPGTKADIVFSAPGEFVVLCGIHPKMRLDVVVK